MNQTVMIEHKKKLNKAKEDKNTENIIEVLLSLRVNALQISPELRKNSKRKRKYFNFIL